MAGQALRHTGNAETIPYSARCPSRNVKEFTVNKLTLAALAATLVPLMAGSAVAQDNDYRWHGGSDNPHWDAAQSYRDGGDRYDRRLSRDDYIYRGGDGRNYCRRSDGSTGLVVGGLAGGAIGAGIGGSALSTLLGAAGGAVIGSSIDRGEVHCR
jgi:hypothetical protein